MWNDEAEAVECVDSRDERALESGKERREEAGDVDDEDGEEVGKVKMDPCLREAFHAFGFVLKLALILEPDMA